MTSTTSSHDESKSGARAASTPSNVAVEFDVPARMRDGVTLRADVYRPVGGGPWPTLLTRTPYGKHVLPELAWSGLHPTYAARRGFMVIVQDTRGRFASDGVWEPFRFEGQDGYDSVEWAAQLGGSNGRVGMFGGSYCGNTQWMPAIARPRSLGAIAPLMTWSDPMDGLFARGGAVEIGIDLAWSVLTGLDHLERLGLSAGDIEQRGTALIEEWNALGDRGYLELPIPGNGIHRRHGVPELGSIGVLDRPEMSDACRVTGRHDRVDVPSLSTAGWYDIFLQGTLDNFTTMTEQGRDARLIVGPWSHEKFSDPIGSRLFGLEASRDGAPVHSHGDWNDFQLAWFRRHLEPGPEVPLPEAPVRIFVMGRNEWREELTWPLARASTQRWFLTSRGGLSRSAPSAEDEATEFVYDPGNPVPTVGGHTVMWPGYPAGAMDQREVEARDDVLVFTSEVLDRDLEVTGRVRMILGAESSAPSTDWVARLCDVHPDGRSYNICDGIARVASDARKPRRYEIDLWSTSNVFLRGHRLRVHVTSSSFPRWDRNLNTGNQREAHHRLAHQRIYHSSEAPSFIELPVVDA